MPEAQTREVFSWRELDLVPNQPAHRGGGIVAVEICAEGDVICAEGYLFEMERRGYLKANLFVPEVVLDNPQVVEQLHRDFVHAGSDVVLAFTYYVDREKLKIIDY